MIRRRFSLLFALLIVVTAVFRINAVAANSGPTFDEVYQLIRSNVTGVSDSELNQAAIQGLVSALGSRVTFVPARAGESAEPQVLVRSSLFDNDVACLRVAGVTGGLDAAVRQAYQALATNELKGVVLDLRYAGGDDYAAAAAVADLFIAKERPLLSWGENSAVARAKTNAVTLPVAVLVNAETAAAAEALAAILREAGAGLIIGGTTAGRAMVSRDYPLPNGSTIRIATDPVRLGDGRAISDSGVRPDIEVTVAPDDERAYYADAFHIGRRTNTVADVAGVGTNGARRVVFNEADLVRQHRGSLDRSTNGVSPARSIEPDKPVVSDPALARAIDLLRGLAVVRQWRS